MLGVDFCVAFLPNKAMRRPAIEGMSNANKIPTSFLFLLIRVREVLRAKIFNKFMKKKVFLAVLAMVGATSFASAQKTTVEINATEARTTDAITSVHARPLICDVKQKKYQAGADWCKDTEFNKIDITTGRFTDRCYLDAATGQALGDTEAMKRYGQYRSQQYRQCDVIIAPIMNVRSTSKDEQGQYNGAAYVVTIIGYAADFDMTTLTNASKEDLLLIQTNKNIIGTEDNIREEVKTKH